MNCRCSHDGPQPAELALPAPSESDPPIGSSRRSPFARLLRGVASLMQWALPITTLALIPKCPACLAAYVLLFTGVGLSFSAATAVRWALIALSVAVLACLALRIARRAFVPHRRRAA